MCCFLSFSALFCSDFVLLPYGVYVSIACRPPRNFRLHAAGHTIPLTVCLQHPFGLMSKERNDVDRWNSTAKVICKLVFYIGKKQDFQSDATPCLRLLIFSFQKKCYNVFFSLSLHQNIV